jgi:hypothetical protein
MQSRPAAKLYEQTPPAANVRLRKHLAQVREVETLRKLASVPISSKQHKKETTTSTPEFYTVAQAARPAFAAHQHDDLPDGASWRSGLSFDWPRQAIPPKRRGGVPAAEPGSRGEGLSKLDRSGLRAAFLREVFVNVFFS